MNGTYDPVLGFAAYGLAVVTCFALFDLGGRIAGFQGLRRAIWLALGAAALGGGLWASHILGLRALRATAPASFDLFRAGLSWLLAAGAAYAALRAIAGQGWQLRSALIAAVLAGLGLYASQYTALWSMRATPAVSYNHSLAAGALLLGMIATVGAIFIGGPLRELPAERVQLAKVSAAVIAGAAVCSAHFTSIAAAHFDFGAACNRANLLAGAPGWACPWSSASAPA
jgi:NO-binding membrane sensor protein with MHYT domain